jgi:hypothetical protein
VATQIALAILAALEGRAPVTPKAKRSFENSCLVV